MVHRVPTAMQSHTRLTSGDAGSIPDQPIRFLGWRLLLYFFRFCQPRSYGALAQLGERRPCKADVASSNLAGSIVVGVTHLVWVTPPSEILARLGGRSKELT